MDPHHLQSNMMNMNAVNGQIPQNQLLGQQSSQQYNPQQMFIQQQQYLNNINAFYNQNSMLPVDIQQQHYLMMQQQAQAQMPQMFQQNQHQAALQQQLNLQNQRFVQVQQQQPQQSLQLQQQRLLEEQQRQIERARQEQEQQRQAQLRAQQEEALRLQKIQEQEEAKRRRELQAKLEAERLEQLRIQEEQARQLLELQRKEEAERIEREKLMRIHEETMKKQREAEQAQREMRARLSEIGTPFTLVATHFFTRYPQLIPFPSEGMSVSKLPSVADPDQARVYLQNVNPDMVATISSVLAGVDVNDIKSRLDGLEGTSETNDLPMDQMPPLIKAVMELNCNALDVDPIHNLEAPDIHLLNEVQAEMSGAPSRSMGRVLGNGGDSVIMNREQHTTSADDEQQPSTSSASMMPSSESQLANNDEVHMEGRDAVQLRRQMASLGKQPKAAQQRKKKDMVESLYDSLTDYFDPSEGRRRRMRNADQRDLDLIAEMEAKEAAGLLQHQEDSSAPPTPSEHCPGMEGPSKAAESDEEMAKFYDKKDRKRKRKEEQPERPPTPTDVIQKRDEEWHERQRKRAEKRKRRKFDDSENECWNNETMAENDSFSRFMSIVDTIFDQVEDIDMMVMNGKTHAAEDEDEEVNSELLIERMVLEDLRNEAQKLKSWKALNKIPQDRLIKLITMLERNMRDVISTDGSRLLVPVMCDEEGDEEGDQALRELVDDRLIRAVNAACTVLVIMTSFKMPKQVFIEDAIERAINLCKHYLNHIIFPASDSMFRSGVNKKKGADDVKKKRKQGANTRNSTVQHIYARIAELLGCFGELVRVQSLAETSIFHLSSMSISSFFVSNVGEVQLQAMSLASNIFSRNAESVRTSMLTDILNSLHRLPPGKNTNNSYRLGPDQWISNTTILVLQLIQSVVKMPKRRRSGDDDEKHEVKPDDIVKESMQDMKRLAQFFINGFLSRSSSKGNKAEGEEDYRRLFDGFLQDLLLALYKPEWPVAETMLAIMGNLLVVTYRDKSKDIALRQASLEYLGTITARLRRDAKLVGVTEDANERLELVVKTLIFEEEQDDQNRTSVDDVDIYQLSNTDRLKKLEQALIDYLVEKKGDSNVSIEYAVMFYVGEWYHETTEDLEAARDSFKHSRQQQLTDKELRKLEKKMERMMEKGNSMKEFLTRLVDKKHMRKRLELLTRLGCGLLDSDVAWGVKYLASRREFAHSFETFLKHILYGVTIESTVSLRTRALKCLTQIIEADHEVLRMDDVRNAVNARMMDPNAAVREATIELLGKFVLVKQELIPMYYPILCERIKDSGTAVRKRVIRIFREICERFPDFEKIPEMLSKMVRRISDEDGVKKLVQETFATLWFVPVAERNSITLLKKVIVMTHMVQQCVNEATVEYFEQLMQALLKQGDKSVIYACRQIVDSLVDNVLVLENKMASDANVTGLDDMAAASKQKNNQERLLACLTTLSIFSKVRPELMKSHAETLQPYLSMSVNNSAEQQVLNEVICMLERAVPLVDHPSESFLDSLDTSLANLAINSGMVIVQSAIGCAAAAYKKFGVGKKQPAMAAKFLYFLRTLNQIKMMYDRSANYDIPQQKIPMLQRAVFTLGILCRHFDFDAILMNDAEALKATVDVPVPAPTADDPDEEPVDPATRRFRENAFMLLEYFSRSKRAEIRHKALTAIGHFCATYSEYLTRPEVKNIYLTVLGIQDHEYLTLKIQTLKNLELFLLAEEKKLIKSNENWDKAKDTQNLKEMELAGSGLGSAVIQVYWTQVLKSYFSPHESVRQAAMQVTWLTLSQGLVTPGYSIPTLIAMTTDPLTTVRNKVENLLKEIDAKYQGMVQSKAVAGIRLAYRLQEKVKKAQQAAQLKHQQQQQQANAPLPHQQPLCVVRGIRACEVSATANNARVSRDSTGLPRMSNDAQAILSGLYQSLRTNRQQRRSFLNSLLRLFSEDSRDKLSLEEWIFVADNIALFPYQVMDEPLYAIRQIDQIVSLSGQAIVNQFKAQLMPSVNFGGANPQQPEDDDTIFEPETLFRRFPDDKTGLYELMLNSQACFILLYLKNFLMKLYGFTDVKVQEYSPSEAAKVYEKAVTRKNVHLFSPQSALEELRPEVIEQRHTFEGFIQLAHKICNFRKMLLSLDRMEDDGDDEIPSEAQRSEANREDDEEAEEMEETDAEAAEPASEAVDESSRDVPTDAE